MSAPKAPYKVGREWPYENARRAGKTHPDVIETKTPEDPRWQARPAANNRRNRRARGLRHRVNLEPQLRNPIPRSVRRAHARRGES